MIFNFRNFRIFNSQRGLSLIELSMALLVSGISIAALVSTVSMSLNAMKVAEQQSQMEALMNDLRINLGDPNRCRNALAGVNFGAGQDIPISIRDGVSRTIATSGGNYEEISLPSVRLRDKGALATQQRLAWLTIQGRTKDQKHGMERSLPMAVHLNNSGNQIIGCEIRSDISESVVSFWEKACVLTSVFPSQYDPQSTLMDPCRNIRIQDFFGSACPPGGTCSASCKSGWNPVPGPSNVKCGAVGYTDSDPTNWTATLDDGSTVSGGPPPVALRFSSGQCNCTPAVGVNGATCRIRCMTF